MLRSKLSTKPFYNERAIHSALAVVGLVVIALTVFNLVQIVLLTRRQSDLNARGATAETQARELRSHAASVRQGIDPKQLEAISGAAREVNVLISERLFSWTDLLNRLETTLPEDVRITAMRSRVEKDGSVTVVMAVVGRRLPAGRARTAAGDTRRSGRSAAGREPDRPHHRQFGAARCARAAGGPHRAREGGVARCFEPISRRNPFTTSARSIQRSHSSDLS